jgi:hypothetical protein
MVLHYLFTVKQIQELPYPRLIWPIEISLKRFILKTSSFADQKLVILS